LTIFIILNKKPGAGFEGTNKLHSKAAVSSTQIKTVKRLHNRTASLSEFPYSQEYLHATKEN
jgi:hypothetical protein